MESELRLMRLLLSSIVKLKHDGFVALDEHDLMKLHLHDEMIIRRSVATGEYTIEIRPETKTARGEGRQVHNVPRYRDDLEVVHDKRDEEEDWQPEFYPGMRTEEVIALIQRMVGIQTSAQSHEVHDEKTCKICGKWCHFCKQTFIAWRNDIHHFCNFCKRRFEDV